MVQGVQADAALAFGGVVPQPVGRQAVGAFVDANRDQRSHRKHAPLYDSIQVDAPEPLIQCVHGFLHSGFS